MDQVEPTNERTKKLLLLYRPGLNPSCYPTVSNLTRTVPDQFKPNRLRVALISLHMILAWCDIRERNCRQGPSGLRRHAESGVNPLPGSSKVMVIQHPHTDNEPRHDRGKKEINKAEQEGHQGTGGCKPGPA